MAKNIGVLIIAALFLIPLVTAAFPTHYDDYVNDFSAMFNANETANLRVMLNQVRVDTTAEVVVSTMVDCTLDYDTYATNLATNWGIGKSDKDNGLLILYCQNVKKLVVKTGYGLEGILPDSKIGRMLDDYYVPLRDSGQLNEGIISVTTQLVQVLEDNKAEIISGQTSGASSSKNIVITIIIVIFVALIIFAVYFRMLIGQNKTKKKGKNYGTFINIFSLLLLVIGAITGLIAFYIIGFILLIIIRIIGRNPASPFFVPVGRFGGGGIGGGSFGGGGFGGGGFGGGGASR